MRNLKKVFGVNLMEGMRMKSLKVLGIGLMMGILGVVLSIGTSGAATLYVDDDGPGPYTEINQAIAFATVGDEIVVKPGTYSAVNVDKLVHIRSEEGPEVTKIISSSSYGLQFTRNGNDSGLSGFYIKGASYGVYINASISGTCERISIKNNIIEGCGVYGIYLYGGAGNRHVYYSNIVNNVISGNGSHGIRLQGGSACCTSYTYIRYNEISNNIIANNGAYGLSGTGYVTSNNYYNNDIFGNADGAYEVITITEADGNIFVDPQFVSAETGNYMLLSGSLCLDAGRAGLTYLDPDGSRSNIGV